MRSASPLLDQSTSVHERTSLEQAFDQFYLDAAQMNTSTYCSNPLQTEKNTGQAADSIVCVSESPLQIRFDDVDQYEQQRLNDEIQSKMLRTTQQILSSIKKRRVNSEGRVTGFELSDLAD